MGVILSVTGWLFLELLTSNIVFVYSENETSENKHENSNNNEESEKKLEGKEDCNIKLASPLPRASKIYNPNNENENEKIKHKFTFDVKSDSDLENKLKISKHSNLAGKEFEDNIEKNKSNNETDQSPKQEPHKSTQHKFKTKNISADVRDFITSTVSPGALIHTIPKYWNII